MRCSVREATPADAAAVHAVHRASIEGLGGAAYDDEQVAAWARGGDPSDYPIGEPDVHVVVAERDGRVVGFGEVRPDPHEEIRVAVDGEVRAVYVHPEHARTGVGTAIYDALEARAREWGLASLGLHASLNAVGFYEARGFEPVAERPHDFDDGVPGTVLEMRKPL